MKRPLMMFCILCMVICVLLRICKSESPPGSLPEVQVSLQGQVTSIENRNNQTILFLSDIFLYGDSAEEITNDNINGVMCYCDGMHEIKLGQTIVVQGFLSLPKQAGNAGEFDALEYYKARGYEYLLKEAVIVKAGQKYIKAIQKLIETELLYDMAEDIQELALLKLENPELSLDALGKMCSEPMTKSSVNRRLQKLCAVAQIEE